MVLVDPIYKCIHVDLFFQYICIFLLQYLPVISLSSLFIQSILDGRPVFKLIQDISFVLFSALSLSTHLLPVITNGQNSKQ